MEENSRLGETSKAGFTSQDKDKDSRKKEDRHGEKIKNTTITPLFGCLLWISIERFTTQKKYHQLDHSKAKKEEETGQNIVNTIGSAGTPPISVLT